MTNKVFGFEYSQAWNYENGFYLTSPSSRLAKSVMHYELYKKILNVPGEILECGVFKGASLIRFATYREMLESQYSRKIIGFDVFGKFPDEVEAQEDREFISRFETSSGFGIPKDELEIALKNKNFVNVDLIQGNILETLPAFVESNPALKIALLHIDVDVYEATKACLGCLYDKVASGGLIVFDDYSRVDGATRAIDEFIKARNISAPLQKLSGNYIPAYMVKQ